MHISNNQCCSTAALCHLTPKQIVVSAVALAALTGLALFAYYGRIQLQADIKVQIVFASLCATTISSIGYALFRCCGTKAKPDAPNLDDPRPENLDQKRHEEIIEWGANIPTPASNQQLHLEPLFSDSLPKTMASVAETDTESTASLPELKSVKDLVGAWDRCWKNGRFVELPYAVQPVLDAFKANSAQFAHFKPKEKTYGMIQRIEVPEKTSIFVRADLHGDLKSLLENLKALQAEGHLNEEFRCQGNVQLIFLGDYADRGLYSMQILHLLAQLRLENPKNVHLIRGNHEDTTINFFYGGNDEHLRDFLRSNISELSDFYQTMILGLYVATEGESREYALFTHGTLEPGFDPAQLLDGEERIVAVPHDLQLSERMKKLADTPGPLQESAQEVAKIVQEVNQRLLRDDQNGGQYTLYNWGDISDQRWLWDIGTRQARMTIEDIQTLFYMSSEKHSVEFLFRGHEHRFKQHASSSQTVIITLPVGADSCERYKKAFDNQWDTAYLLTTASRIEEWTKAAYFRAPGTSKTRVNKANPIHLTLI